MTRLIYALTLCIISLPAVLRAHALDPAYLELATLQDNQWRVSWRVPDVSGQPMQIGVDLPESCAGSTPPPPVFDGRGWVTGWVVTCPAGLSGGLLGIPGLDLTSTEALVRYELRPGETQVHRLTSAAPVFIIPADPGLADIFISYVALGVTHILEGIDHLLFVFALVLLIRERGRLLWTITAFTVAHSLTLAASVLGLVTLPPPPVEAVIAFSIVFLAYELTLPPEARDQIAMRFPWVVSFAFGLIHGLGFAGALREIGLPQGDIPLALVSFNVGVEIGQVLFIAVVLIIGYLARRFVPLLQGAHLRLDRVAGYGIGSVAAFWVIERIAAF